MHVAIIMDGNGRWATQRGLTRATGHRRGAQAVRDIVRAATREPIDVLTLYAFSSDNWSRPNDEVRNLMRLLKRHLISETAQCVDNGVRVSIIGRRDRLASGLLQTITNTEAATQAGTQLELRLAIDYSGREAIERASAIKALDPEKTFPCCLTEAIHAVDETPPVDLLIRTGGEHRLSDFLLWESAYAELLFIDTYWPDFDEPEFLAALEAYQRRERRFGGVPGTVLRTAGIG
jgi:undecaprenyl diphosphate synthase